MNDKYTKIEDVEVNKVVSSREEFHVQTIPVTISVSRNKFLIGFVDWNSSTQAGVYPFLDRYGNLITIPLGSVTRNIYLKQAGDDDVGASLLKGSATVKLYFTNRNSSGNFTTTAEPGVITPKTSTLLPFRTADQIGLNSVSGYVNFIGSTVQRKNAIYNFQNYLDTNQAIYLCALISGPADNVNSILQVAVSIVF